MAEQKIEVKSPKITIAPSIENELWNAPWNITLTADPEIRIGTASFVGEKEMGTLSYLRNTVRSMRQRCFP